MLNSKQLKESPKQFMKYFCGCPEEFDPKCGYFGYALHFVCKSLMFKIYYPAVDFVNRTKERLFRAIAYARFGYLNYDFDMAFVWYLFEFKLKRLRKCLQNGHAVQEPEDMEALNKLIKIVRRLGMDRYENKYNRQHNKIWGKIEAYTTPNYDENGKIKSYRYHTYMENCPEGAPKKLKDKERKERMKCYENGEKDRIKDLELMKELLAKHGLKFWD